MSAPRPSKGPLTFLRREYEAGDPLALLVAVEFFLNWAAMEDDSKGWIADDFSHKLRRFLLYECATLDKAFGIKRPRNRSVLTSRRKKIRVIGEVIARINAAKAAGRSVNSELFEEVGTQVGFAKSEVKDLWKQRHDLRGWAKSNFSKSEAMLISHQALGKAFNARQG